MFTQHNTTLLTCGEASPWGKGGILLFCSILTGYEAKQPSSDFKTKLGLQVSMTSEDLYW